MNSPQEGRERLIREIAFDYQRYVVNYFAEGVAHARTNMPMSDEDYEKAKSMARYLSKPYRGVAMVDISGPGGPLAASISHTFFDGNDPREIQAFVTAMIYMGVKTRRSAPNWGETVVQLLEWSTATIQRYDATGDGLDVPLGIWALSDASQKHVSERYPNEVGGASQSFTGNPAGHRAGCATTVIAIASTIFAVTALIVLT